MSAAAWNTRTTPPDSAADEAPLSLGKPVETPENAVLSYQVAGPAQRAWAYLIDLFIRWLLLLGAAIVAVVMSLALSGIAAGMFLVIYFATEWLYYILLEHYWAGQTPGKRWCGLRVIHTHGEPLTWWGSVLRNLLRGADTLPLMVIYGVELGPLTLLPLYGPALVCMWLTPRLQRIGDVAARTMVIQVRPVKLPRDPIILERIAPLERGEINGFVPTASTLNVIDQFLGRRSALTYDRGHALAAPLARRLAVRLQYAGDREQVTKFPMAFLARVYVTFVRRGEAEAAETPVPVVAAGGGPSKTKLPSFLGEGRP